MSALGRLEIEQEAGFTQLQDQLVSQHGETMAWLRQVLLPMASQVDAIHAALGLGRERAPLRNAFDKLLTSYLALFAGRAALIAEIERRLPTDTGGYFVVTGRQVLARPR